MVHCKEWEERALPGGSSALTFTGEGQQRKGEMEEGEDFLLCPLHVLELSESQAWVLRLKITEER